MQVDQTGGGSARPRQPWNAGPIVGPKAPLQAKHIWEIRTRLKMAGRVRDLALFNLAIDSKLRGCDVVKQRIADVMAGGGARQRSTVVQRKTSRPVQIADWTGGYESQAVAPARNCVAIPDSMDAELAALTKPMTVAGHAALQAEVPV